MIVDSAHWHLLFSPACLFQSPLQVRPEILRVEGNERTRTSWRVFDRMCDVAQSSRSPFAPFSRRVSNCRLSSVVLPPWDMGTMWSIWKSSLFLLRYPLSAL